MINLNKCDIRIAQKVILKDVTVTIEPKTTTIIEGENGSGKTVLMNSLLGLNKSVDGEVKRKINRKAICYITDSPFFFDDERVIDVIRTIAYFYCIPIDEVFDILLDLHVDFKNKEKMLMSQLSKGMKKKLLIVPIFFKQHQVFFLDEIFTGLDKETQNIVLKRLKSIIANKQTLVIIEHNQNIVDEIKSMSINGGIIKCIDQKIKYQAFQ